MLDPTPELPDDTLVSRVQFPTRILKVLAAAGLRTVGEVREASNEMLLLSEKLQGIANDTPKTLQISWSIFAQ
jgi:hypothetical protein